MCSVVYWFYPFTNSVTIISFQEDNLNRLFLSAQRKDAKIFQISSTLSSMSTYMWNMGETSNLEFAEKTVEMVSKVLSSALNTF